MTLNELLQGLYAWAVTQRFWILFVAVVLPAAGTLVARIGKAGKTDADGRVVASVVVGIGLAAVFVEILGIFVGHSLMGVSVLNADVALLAAPLLCLVLALAGIRWVFPLNELASVRTFYDVAAFVGACVAIIWLLSKFRGWGFIFFGSLAQFATIAVFAWVLLRRLYRRAFARAILTSDS